MIWKENKSDAKILKNTLIAGIIEVLFELIYKVFKTAVWSLETGETNGEKTTLFIKKI